MKSYIFTLGTLLTLASCGGNPHIHSTNGGLENTNPPLTLENGDTGCKLARATTGIKFFFKSVSKKNTGLYPEDFLPFTKCKTLVKETFNSFLDGEVLMLTNADRTSSAYEMVRKAEVSHAHDKIIYMEDIFTAANFPMNVADPILSGNLMGSDRGVDSQSASGVKDSLIWSFKTPVLSWGVHMLNLRSEGSQKVKMRVFDCNHSLIEESNVTYSGTNGSGQFQFIGFAGGLGEVCHVSLTAGHENQNLVVDELVYALDQQ